MQSVISLCIYICILYVHNIHSRRYAYVPYHDNGGLSGGPSKTKNGGLLNLNPFNKTKATTTKHSGE